MVEGSGEDRPVDGPIHAQQRPEPVGGERGNERHVWPAVRRYSLVQALAVGRAAVAAAIGQGGAGFVHEYQARKIFFRNSFHQQAPQCYDAFGAAFGGADAFFAFPAQLFHGQPHARAAQRRATGGGQRRAYFGQGGIGLLAQAGRELGVARRVQARGRAGRAGQPANWSCADGARVCPQRK